MNNDEASEYKTAFSADRTRNEKKVLHLCCDGDLYCVCRLALGKQYVEVITLVCHVSQSLDRVT